VIAMPRNVVEEALTLMCDNYIFPDRAEQTAAAIRTRLAAGEYDGLDEQTLADRLTAHLLEASSDKHLRVRTRPAALPDLTPEQDADARWQEWSRLDNHGIAKVERMAGNVGYLDLRLVADPGQAGTAIAAAMELVSRTHALIIDLRKNQGGWPEGVIFWVSYLLPDGTTHLNDIEDRAGAVQQFWSLSYVPGERYLDRPVYVLTSAATFSGGEEFCYNLQTQGRATLIGQATGGGAHPRDAFLLTPTLEIHVPIKRSVNPVTGTNWEGTGVQPDVLVPAEQALAVGYRRALEHVLTVQTSDQVLEEARAALLEPWLNKSLLNEA
jgi:C-terminal processing protease CtpA/Prc